MENFSLSDLATAVRGSGENGIAGGDFLILILLFVMLSGGNLFGNKSSNPVNDYATSATQQEILFGQRFDALGSKLNQVGDGICSSTYALNNAIVGEGRTIQQSISDCCCSNKELISQVRYDMATMNAQTNANIDAKFAALEKAQLEQTINSLNSKIGSLELNQALCGVMRYPTNSAYAYSLPSANCSCNNNI